MTHLTVHEWGSVSVGTQDEGECHTFTRAQANLLLAVARAHPLANKHGTNILIDRHSKIFAGQMVGVIAAPGCSLEILPKIDNEANESDTAIRSRLIRMLDVALGLKLGHGQVATMARQNSTLLDILIRLFADRLLTEVKRGLPHAYMAQEDDLSALKGRLNVTRQFTTLSVRPDRLACRYDTLSADTALLRIMKSCVIMLRSYAHATETIRRLNELHYLFADISDVSLSQLPWSQVNIDRTNRRWGTLYEFARLFLNRSWQATHHDRRAQTGFTLLFPMNDLFESYVAALARKAIHGRDWTLCAQGGRLFCLTEEKEDGKACFQTKPDLLIKQSNKNRVIIDTKWKCIRSNIDDPKSGVLQADVYQMMAYGQIYDCAELILLYPHHNRLGNHELTAGYRILAGEKRLTVASVELAHDENTLIKRLYDLISAAFVN